MSDVTTLAISGLSASGSFVASFVALRIASRARADSNRQSYEAQTAQARLVRLRIEGVPEQRAFAVEVENWGEQPILDIALVGAAFYSTYKLPPMPKPVLTPPQPRIPVLVPKSREALAPPRFFVDFRVGDESILVRDDSVGYDPVTSNSTKISAIIEFTDAHGLHWRQSSGGEPQRVTVGSSKVLNSPR